MEILNKKYKHLKIAINSWVSYYLHAITAHKQHYLCFLKLKCNYQKHKANVRLLMTNNAAVWLQGHHHYSSILLYIVHFTMNWSVYKL